MIAETPDKEEGYRQTGSLAINRRPSFYSGAGSRNVQRFEDSVSASLLAGTTSCGAETSGGLENGGGVGFATLFPHLVNRKRKREESEVAGLSDGFQQQQEVSPQRRVRRKLNSFLESSEPFVTSCHPQNTTPVKRKVVADQLELVSPRRVQFNMKPQPPTPKSGVKARSILKTPNKGDSTPGKQSPFISPFRTPNKTQFKTPIKTPSRVSKMLSMSPMACWSPLAQEGSPVSRLTPIKNRSNLGSPSGKLVTLSSLPCIQSPLVRQPAVSPVIRAGRKPDSLVSTLQFEPPLMSTLQFEPPLMSTLANPLPEPSQAELPELKRPVTDFTDIIDEEAPTKLLPPARSEEGIIEAMTTQDILNCSSVARYSSTLVRPGSFSQLPEDIFSNSLDGFSSMVMSVPGTPTKSPPTQLTEELELVSPAKRADAPPVQLVRELELVSPVKRCLAAPSFTEEIEFTSPTRRAQLDRLVQGLESEEEVETENSVSVTKFPKTNSEQSLVASEDPAHPSSGYSSGPHQEPPSSLGYTSEHSSPGRLQLSSPLRPRQRSAGRASRELAGLQDKMTPYFTAGTARRTPSQAKAELMSPRSSAGSETSNKLPAAEAKKCKTTKDTEETTGSRKKAPKGKRIKSLQEEVLTKSTKKRKLQRQSMKPVYYAEDSITDEEELVKMVSERYGDDEDETKTEEDMWFTPKTELNLKVDPSSNIILKSPARFKCRYCTKKFRTRKSVTDHEAEEIRHIADARKEVATKSGLAAQVSSGGSGGAKLSRELSGLSDRLSQFFSPVEERARRAPDRLAVEQSQPVTPRSSRPNKVPAINIDGKEPILIFPTINVDVCPRVRCRAGRCSGRMAGPPARRTRTTRCPGPGSAPPGRLAATQSSRSWSSTLAMLTPTTHSMLKFQSEEKVCVCPELRKRLL